MKRSILAVVLVTALGQAPQLLAHHEGNNALPPEPASTASAPPAEPEDSDMPGMHPFATARSSANSWSTTLVLISIAPPSAVEIMTV